MQRRQTKYSKAVKQVIQHLDHATNLEIHMAMQGGFPNVSATTIHRVTKRLVDEGEISLAPSKRDGSARFDSVIEPHDHFVCNECERLRDVDIAGAVIPVLESTLEGCKISGRLVIYGTCQQCHKKEKK